MLWLRSALYMTVLAVTVAPYAIGTLLWSWLPAPKRYYMATRWTKFAVWAGRVICGIRWHVEGWENLPNGPAILLSKHQSAWETLWLPSYMPRPLSFVYKRELHWVPFFGWGLATLGMINIDRAKGQDAFEQIVQQGAERLRDGWWIVIFPEGTRTPPGSSRRYKSGGARLSVRTGTPVVPIALNSGEVWPRRSFIKRPGTITVSIGKPIDPRGRSAEELAALVQSWIETEMRRIAPHRYSGPYVSQREPTPA
ncbi:MAG: lysophospholipid acyltransferase family protein [Sutterellaceae bacterium]|nr:1-acyl-sn-glycerol-3-phosphate acyltransferase [Burkholderiaceae bacterium]MDW8429896.1 lysophospholipid acyltransferase family protein [Sutterellaceae bacterium]